MKYYTFALKYISAYSPNVEGKCVIKAQGNNPIEAIMKIISTNSFPDKNSTFVLITSIVIQ
ncbi:hypothetical protein [Klebsiella phage phiKp_21]|nr:hypothetical protein CPT_Muenster_508 [Klebsiella phage Muenster]BEH88481.1 hypothetical protein [Klebsiella phage phiKp_21]